METIVNRVANSPLKTINLEHFYPETDFVSLDLKDFLFQGLLLKEKDFRASMKAYPWDEIGGKTLLIYCSTDAIIPVWAYSLVAKYASTQVKNIYVGNQQAYLSHYYQKVIEKLDVSAYKDQMVVIKGCSDKEVPPAAYAFLTAKLVPIVKSVMYGEPCSTVPIYKRPKV